MRGLACHSQPAEDSSHAPVAPASSDTSGTAASASAPEELPDRDPALARRLVKDEHALLLDVRTLEEWNAGHLEGAAHVPVDELQSRLPELSRLTGGDKQKPIVTYCRTGGRAGRAKKLLQEAGYQRVTNLGGMQDWPSDDVAD